MKTKALNRSSTNLGRTYDADLYGWIEDQMVHLRSNEVGSIDASNITQELTDLGRSEFDKLVSAIRIVLLHLLKWDHQLERRSRSWVITIDEHRKRITYELSDSPSLKPRIQDAIVEAYRAARSAAARETGFTRSTFPETCTYRWDDITHRRISWEGESSPDVDES